MVVCFRVRGKKSNVTQLDYVRTIKQRKWRHEKGYFAENEAPGNERRMRKAKIKDDI